jgi:hypothetical protein
VLTSVATLLEETNETTRALDNLDKLRDINSWVDFSTLDKASHDP